MKPGVPPSCECGTCRLCYLRRARQRYYQKNKTRVIRENAARKNRQQRKPDVSDAELDRRALLLMGRRPDAR